MTDLVKTEEKEESVLQPQNRLPVAVIKAQLFNDWSKTTEEQRVKACLELCHILGIPTPMNPFRFITLKNKLTLYAPNEAAQLIADSRKASVEIKNKYIDKDRNIFVVEVEVSTPYRKVQNFGALYLGGLSGQDLANAMMKCATKAQRRTVFGAFGLSIADDDDVEAARTTVSQTSGVTEASAKPGIPFQSIMEVSDTEEGRDIAEANLDARKNLFRRLVGKGGLFGNDVKKATKWIADWSEGKSLEMLSIDDCGALESAIDDLNGQEEPIDISEAAQNESKSS